MIKRLFSVIFKKEFPKNNPINENGKISSYYIHLIRDIEDSKYCSISDNEEIFIKNLLIKLNQSNEHGALKLRRMSDKAIDFSYNGFPIGRIKMHGNNTWMQILLSLYDFKQIENVSLEEYIENIDLWIKYIKKVKNI
ncbi:hypothetical protein V7122_02545 [Bacillus sp. JJ1532]|uniref:hypothetical protein n=1 Tax=unclassified Bacillus (in: firmicutes) TaxID=185979 RepID=UPI003000EA7E